MNRKLWIDGAEMAVITTTRNGEMIAVCWGQTSATARPLPTLNAAAQSIGPSAAADAVLALLKGQDA